MEESGLPWGTQPPGDGQDRTLPPPRHPRLSPSLMVTRRN